MAGEFELIQQYFCGLQELSTGLVLGIGDDAAVLELAAGEQLVVATDTLVEGVHFPVGLDAGHIAARTLLTNLSDLAAMGADPRWFTLALTLAEASETWLAGFSRGLSRVASRYRCALVGGDITRGSLTVTITVHGVVPCGQALTRCGASSGDSIFVTGTPGLGAAGLRCLSGELAVESEAVRQRLVDKFLNPSPRLGTGRQLRGIASAVIDISDGLVADLGHICSRSAVGARLDLAALSQLPWPAGSAGYQQRMQWALSGGDDYELCFTVPSDRLHKLQALEGEVAVTRIGEIVGGDRVACFDQQGREVAVQQQGYRHF